MQGAKAAGVNVQIEWMPFFLNESTPEEGYDFSTYIDMKYGKGASAPMAPRMEQMRHSGELVGIKFNPNRRVVRTMDAHRIMEHTNTKFGPTKGDELMEELFKAYFEEAIDVSKEENLLAVVAKVPGLSVEEARAALDGKQGSGGASSEVDELTKAVRAKDAQAKREFRVNGVPFFVIEGGKVSGGQGVRGTRWGNFKAVSGAQPASVFAELLSEE